MGWKHWYESGKILNGEGKRVYHYDYRDNEEDGFCIGLYPEITEQGEWLPCFLEIWREGSVAVRQWNKLRRGDVGGMEICNCGKHIAIWSAGQGLLDLIERTLSVYEIDETTAKKLMEKNGFWDGHDSDLRKAIEK